MIKITGKETSSNGISWEVSHPKGYLEQSIENIRRNYLNKQLKMIEEIAKGYVDQLNALKDDEEYSAKMTTVLDKTVEFYLQQMDEQFEGTNSYIIMWCCINLAEYMSLLPAGTLMAERNSTSKMSEAETVQHNDEVIEIIRSIFISILVSRFTPDYEEVAVITKNGFETKEKKPWSYK